MNDYDAIADFYDCEHEGFRDDISFYRSLVDKGPVLEVGVGTGRLTTPLAQSGVEVWGIEPSTEMLSRARGRLSGLNNVHLVQTSIVEMDLDVRFRTCILPLNTLWHLPAPEDQLEALRVVQRHLLSGGRIVIDVSNPLTMADRGADGVVRLRFNRSLENREIVGFSAAWDDEGEQVLRISLMYDESETGKPIRRTRADLTLRYIYRAELELLLRLAGFSHFRAYGSYDLEAYTAASPNILAIAVSP